MSTQTPLGAKEYGLDVGYSPLLFKQLNRAFLKEDYLEVIRLCLDLGRCRGYFLYSDQKKVQDFLQQLQIESEVINNGFKGKTNW